MTKLAPGLMVTPGVRLVRPLGRGGMGRIWVAEHLRLQTPVAVKFIASGLAESAPSVLPRFEREAALAAKIKSPHAVQVFDYGAMDDGTPYIVMELCEGNSLREWLDLTGPLSLRQVALIVAQAAEVLGLAHRLGIVHRDIKPENLFLIDSSYEVFVKVLDFGLAKAQDASLSEPDALTATGATVGTPQYMSPEQLFFPQQADHRADLWALAVVAYEALTGRLPFPGHSVAALGAALRAGSFPPPSAARRELPQEIDEWFARALHRDIDARFRSARKVSQALVRAIAAAGAWELGAPAEDLGRDGLPEAGAGPARPLSWDDLRRSTPGQGPDPAAPEPDDETLPLGRRAARTRLPLVGGAFAAILALGALVLWARSDRESGGRAAPAASGPSVACAAPPATPATEPSVARPGEQPGAGSDLPAAAPEQGRRPPASAPAGAGDGAPDAGEPEPGWSLDAGEPEPAAAGARTAPTGRVRITVGGRVVEGRAYRKVLEPGRRQEK